MSAAPPLLEVDGITKRFGGLTALSEVTFSIRKGEIYGLIGPNGAGKTTLFNVLTGIYPHDEGRMRFDGEELRGATPDGIARRGIARTFQNIRLFANLSALENVMIGRHVRTRAGVVGAILRDRATREEEAAILRRAHELLRYVGIARRGLAMVPEGRGIFAQLTVDENLAMGAYARDDRAAVAVDVERVFTLFPRLKERRMQVAGTLSGGEQQMLAIGRALMSRPRLLLLDEPSMGLAPLMVERIFEVVRAIAAEGVTLLLVEQNARLALEASHRGYVLESGTVAFAGEAAALLEDPRVRQAYLGE